MQTQHTGPLLPTSIWATCLPVALVTAAVTYAVWRILGSPLTGADDANIFFVYARNLAHGHGIVYNVGGGHVEGFSSVLYLIICTIAYLCTPTPEKLLFFLNFLFAVATSTCILYILTLLADRIDAGRATRLIFLAAYVLWLAANPAYFAWNIVSLMDSGVFSLIITLTYTLLARIVLRETPPARRDTIQLTALVALTVLSRPEGPAWAALEIAAFACICWSHSQSPRQALKALALPVAGFALTFFALLAFRELYFGYPLPNTFYAKVSASTLSTYLDGRGYLGRFLRFYSPFIVLALFFSTCWIVYAAVIGERNSVRFHFVALTTAFALTGLCLPVLEGGDHFNGFRLFQNIYPLLGIAAVLPLVPFLVPGKPYRKAAYVLSLAVLLAVTSHASWPNFRAANAPGGLTAQTDQRQRIRIEFTVAANGRDNGQRLGQMFAGNLPTIGVAAAGGIALTYPGTVYDLMGLNDTRMAHADPVKSGPKGHESFNKQVFYALSPDILMPVAVTQGTNIQLAAIDVLYGSPASFDNQIYKNIFVDARFQSLYQLALVQNPQHPESIAYGYFRRAYLNQLVSQGALKLLAGSTN
jgi:arabinofuranosyltransferase